MHVPVVYYDANSRECYYFQYGGCDGNANRFKTIEECEETCKKKTLRILSDYGSDHGTKGFKQFWFNI